MKIEYKLHENGKFWSDTRNIWKNIENKGNLKMEMKNDGDDDL